MRPSKAPVIDPDVLERAKRASPLQLLFRCARRFNEKVLAEIEGTTGLAIRASHTALFPHIDLEGTRQSDLAERLGVSKQAVNKLVAELESFGVLERCADPTDARATLVRFSQQKGKTLLDGLATLARTEQKIARVLGSKRSKELHATLLALDTWLDEEEAR